MRATVTAPHLHHGDCIDVMAAMEPESVDAIVTDPPYDLTSTGARKGSPRNPGTGPYSRGFMGKAWDGTAVAFRRETWEAALRVARPSSYLLAFGGTRTVHRMTVALEDAGWVIRDMLVWAYASGFPKSKASLKPAWEPIVMARKPGPLRMLAIDACRIPSEPHEAGRDGEATASTRYTDEGGTNIAALPGPRGGDPAGRWPSNVVLTSPIFDGGVEGVVGGGETVSGLMRAGTFEGHESYGGFRGREMATDTYGDSGTYSRFFLIPKADRADREPVAYMSGADREGPLDDLSSRFRTKTPRTNVHPTVKPVDLMRHLVRLITPSGGTVLDPFLGSGTTAIAAEMEGFGWVGIEREAEYVAIAEARLNGVQRGLGLEAS